MFSKLASRPIAIGVAASLSMALAATTTTSNDVASCDSSSPVPVSKMLSTIQSSLSRIEATLGIPPPAPKYTPPSGASYNPTVPSVPPVTPHGIDIVLGAQWGDEGKGKLVDILSQTYDVCARLKSLELAGVKWEGRIKLSDRAHLVFDFHQEVDGKQESKLGRNKIGTTKKGIGPAYASKISRNGVRVGDLKDMEYFEERFRILCDYQMQANPGLKIDVEKELDYYRKISPYVQNMTTDTIEYTNQAYLAGKKILVEGANATMLDIDFGTYPFVTSSNPSIGSVLTGLGVSPRKLNGIYGTVKAYCTRVGEGPFPTELVDQPGSTGEFLRSNGYEFGTTTGRPRRCGWLDIPQMKFSTNINGFTSLNLTKLDVLTGLPELKIGIRYTLDGKPIDTMPANLKIMTSSKFKVEYEVLPGWTEDISTCTKFAELPPNAQKYVLRVQELIGVPIRWIGVGPNRLDVVDRGPGWDVVEQKRM
ncbi:hypothetical protein TrRE_jg1042 [Triparma retinervis]|uniref:Adenylosuccinate synthetase n=1 Tax=Triparma retinervis TaxID=2557542 RepID=A0A9W7FDE1_9STRA|nr:hypothetical protein TrRE_jg1042 [Triparma retinervis]